MSEIYSGCYPFNIVPDTLDKVNNIFPHFFDTIHLTPPPSVFINRTRHVGTAPTPSGLESDALLFKLMPYKYIQKDVNP